MLYSDVREGCIKLRAPGKLLPSVTSYLGIVIAVLGQHFAQGLLPNRLASLPCRVLVTNTTYNNLLAACAKSAPWRATAEVFSRMKREGVKANTRVGSERTFC